jgi:hypothetical protein
VINSHVLYQLSYAGITSPVEAERGFEPLNDGFADRCVTTSPLGRRSGFVEISTLAHALGTRTF